LRHVLAGVNAVKIRGTFKKTTIGLQEVEQRLMGLRPPVRRLLIVVDGIRSVESLETMFRPSELQELLDELLALGMIAPTETATSFLPTGARDIRDVKPLQPQQFAASRDAAAKSAEGLLGKGAKPFVTKITQARDSIELRKVVSEVQLELLAKLGPDAATLYLETLRAASRDATM
jgi:hypothetical protein